MSACVCSAPDLRRWPLKVLLFLAAVLPLSADCPKPCVCNVPTEVHCTFRYLTAVPDTIQPAVERINLGYNSITMLRENDLSGLEHLKILLLHSNTIHSIEDRVFKDLKSLQILKISYNKVKKINKDTFRGLDSLLRLHIDHNHIDFINPEAFYGLNNLELVSLEGNHIQQLHSDTFVTLRHSQVFKVSSIRSIDLSDNLLTTLPKDVFSACIHLENLFLHGNPWKCDCRMKWFTMWQQRGKGVLKCKTDRRHPGGQQCPVCESPLPYYNRPISLFHYDDFSCTKPLIHPHLKQRNLSLDEGDFNPVSAKDFIVPLGSIKMNLTDQFHKYASLSCTVQRPTAFDNLTLIMEEEEGNNVTVLTTGITTYLVCNINYDSIRQVWQILATYSDSPMRLERGLMLARSPEMVYKYEQINSKDEKDGINTDIEAEIKASPIWLMQGEVSFQLDRTATTYSTLHIKYKSVVNLRVEKTPKKERYSWTMIKRDNQTKTEHTVVTGGVVQLNCQVQGDPKPLLEWILADGSKVRAPYSSEDRRIIITTDGKLSLRGADASDTGLYWCIGTNYLDADILIFRVTVLSPDVEETEVNGVQLSKALGENLFLNCSSSGSPEASVSWILPDHSVVGSSHGNRKLYSNGSLLIQGVTARDRGFYLCLVSNYLGVDLLVSKVTLTEEIPVFATDLNSEGSGMAMKEEMGSSLIGNTIKLNEIPPSDITDRSSQESRTITSDQPYPRHRTHGRGGFGGRLGHRRNWRTHNRHTLSSRVLDKASRKVDPQKFAELMKKAHNASRKKPEEEIERFVPSVYMLERTSKPPSNGYPVTLQFAVTDSSQETQLQFSGEPSAESEIFTDETPSLTTAAIITPVRAVPGRVDSESKTAFTAVTKTERQQDEITFHTTQTIKSPHLPAGSTIISKQQVHIIPHRNSRRKGVRRIVKGRRRIIKPNEISVIQSFISKLKQPTIRKEENASAYKIKLSTDCDCDDNKKKMAVTNLQLPTPTISPTPVLHKTERPATTQKNSASITNFFISSNTPLIHYESRSEVSIEYISSAFAPDFAPSVEPLVTDKEPAVPTTVTTSTASRVIHGRIPWNKLFGVREREHILRRLRKPISSPKKTSSTAETTTVTRATTLAAATSTASQTEPQTPSKQIQSKGSSSDDSYGDLSSSDFQFTALMPLFHHTSTASSFDYSRSSSNVITPSELETLPSPPTVKPYLNENPTEALSSGSGVLPDNLLVIRQGGTRRRPGRQRGPFRGRRPLRKPGFSSKLHTTTTKALTTEVTTMETTTEATIQPQQAISFNKPIYSLSKKNDRTIIGATDQKSPEDTGFHKEFYGSSDSLPTSAATKMPFSTYIIHNPTVTWISSIVKFDSNIRPPKQHDNNDNIYRLPTGKFKPTVESKDAKSRPDKDITFDTTIPTAEQGYSTSSPASNTDRQNAISTVYNHEANSVSSDGFKSTTKDTSKPKIVGGNAASFTILSNSDAFLPCETVGNPKPVITWKHFSSSTGRAVTINGKMGKFELLDNGTLSIQNANIKDHGQYLCLAENSHGSDKLLITLSVVAYPSRILEPKMRELKSFSGNTVAMNCKAEGRPMPTISWILANRTQVRGQNTKKGQVHVSSEGSLIIEKVSVFDRGLYKCIASNPAGVDTATVRLQVVAAPPGIAEEKRQELKVSQSQNLWLPCTGYGSPQPSIHWVLHDGSVIRAYRPASDPRISMYENGTLHIQDVTTAESGKYECIATSSTGSDRRVVTLMVETQLSAPEIVETSQRITVLSFGDQLKLNCSATGDPKPKIIWRLPSKAVVDHWHRLGSRIRVLDNGTLIVNTVSDKDAGDYLCMAQSKIGDDLQLMRVSVSMKPAKIEPKLYNKKQVTYGNDLKVDCKASGAPKPEISWGLPDGTLVNSALQSDASSGGGRSRRYTLFDNGTLYLNQVGMSEEGDYTCYAENQVGKDEMHVHITVVTAPPKIHASRQSFIKVKPGGNIRFDCDAFGEPKPKILWMLPTKDVIAASNERYLMHVNGSLDIRDVKLMDAGEYVCIARNPGGEKRIVYKLNIVGTPPVINGYRQNRTVVKEFARKHSRKRIDCMAEGDPTPTITWIIPDNIFLKAPYFGSRIIVHHNGTLEIRNVRPTDTAEFICLAKNDGGDATMVVQLEVTSMLKRPIFRNPFNEKIVSQTGKTTILNCSASGQPMPEIIWTLPNGTRLTGGLRQSSHQYLISDGTLVIHNVGKENAGKYRCGAKNLVGYIEKLIILDIGLKPYILSRPRGIIRSLFGEPLFLHCLSDGSPKPMIHWTVPGGHTLTWPQVPGRYQLLENGTLIVQDTTLRDRGNYICRARNNAGEAVLTVPVIIVAYSPRITMAPPPSVRGVTGTPLHLNCAAAGIPKPEITWELPDHLVLSAAEQGRAMGSEVLHPQGTLIIQRPTGSDSGTYKCFARNHLGTDSRITNVLVL
ncbi:immunoglobulin superfamily member 10 [Pholidichthys leucotaenia]